MVIGPLGRVLDPADNIACGMDCSTKSAEATAVCCQQPTCGNIDGLPAVKVAYNPRKLSYKRVLGAYFRGIELLRDAGRETGSTLLSISGRPRPHATG